MNFNLFSVLCFTVLSISLARKKPSDFFHLCSLRDPDLSGCLKKSMELDGPMVMKGIPEMKLPPQDPFFIPKIETEQGLSGMKLKVIMSNLTITGQKHHKLQTVKVSKGMKWMNFTTFTPKIDMDGEYSMDGLIMNTPVTGHGHMHIEIENAQMAGHIKFEKYDNNGQMYFRVKDTKWKIEPKNVHMNLTNLFNGDKMLGDATNNFLNENWKEAYSTVRDIQEDAFDMVFKEYINKILTSYPAKEWFKP